MITKDQIIQLIAAAAAAREHAFAHISQYSVGAAVLAENGTIITGANIEPQVLHLACCAERVALFSAFAQGHHAIQALALVTQDGATPCGTCRQCIYDLCGQIPIIVAKPDGVYRQYTLEQLLPEPFNKYRSCGC